MATPLLSPFQETLDAQTAYIKWVSVIAERGDDVATLTPSSGSLTQDARRSFRWDGQLTVPVEDELIPTTPFDLLSPFGTTITIRLGVILEYGVEADVPYGVYDLEDSKTVLANDARAVNLTLVDLGQRLARYRFEDPFEIPAATDLADAVQMVVQDRLGVVLNLPATGRTLDRPRIFGLEPELDPARELLDLAANFGYRIWFDREGALQLDQTPIPDPNAAQPFAGTLTAQSAFDHHPPNVVVARGEASDGTTPIQGVAYDDDPASPTYAGTTPGQSAYGRVSRFFASPLITTQAAADQAAQSMLAGFAARAATWNVTKPFEPTTDPDDILSIALDGDTTLPLVVDAITVNVSGETAMQCRAVSQVIG